MKTKLKLTIEQIQDAMQDYGGWCLACGDEAYGCEPDARNYECESCGKSEVYGAEELLLMGYGD